jgi:hypothetical protein
MEANDAFQLFKSAVEKAGIKLDADGLDGKKLVALSVQMAALANSLQLPCKGAEKAQLVNKLIAELASKLPEEQQKLVQDFLDNALKSVLDGVAATIKHLVPAAIAPQVNAAVDAAVSVASKRCLPFLCSNVKNVIPPEASAQPVTEPAECPAEKPAEISKPDPLTIREPVST